MQAHNLDAGHPGWDPSMPETSHPLLNLERPTPALQKTPWSITRFQSSHMSALPFAFT